jgi:uncharacterized protein with WD repeat
MMQNESGSQN